MRALSTAQQAAIQQQVREQFDRLLAAIGRKDAAAWSALYSQDGFLSAVAGTDRYAARRAWVDTITGYFAARESQQVDLQAVQVTALAADLALLTSQEQSTMRLADGQTTRCAHVFTMLWHQEPAGWKIIHSHESWLDD